MFPKGLHPHLKISYVQKYRQKCKKDRNYTLRGYMRKMEIISQTKKKKRSRNNLNRKKEDEKIRTKDKTEKTTNKRKDTKKRKKIKTTGIVLFVKKIQQKI